MTNLASKKIRPPRRIMRRAALVALLSGEPVCSCCDGWGTDRVDPDVDCVACSGQGVSGSVHAVLAPALAIDWRVRA